MSAVRLLPCFHENYEVRLVH